MTTEERARLIARYSQGPDEVSRSLADFPPEALTQHPIPGKWSACEIVHHLADSESESGMRLRRLIYAAHAHGHADQIRRLHTALKT